MKFNLEKEEKRVKFVLEKRNLPKMCAAVGITLDVSSSMQGLYREGRVQRVVEQIVPVGLRFDDNGCLDVKTFSSGESYVSDITKINRNNYEGFVEREILSKSSVPKWGGTDYYPVIKNMLIEYGFYRAGVQGNSRANAVPKAKGWVGRLWQSIGLGNDEDATPSRSESNRLVAESTSGEPVINYFLTDGENDDKTHVRDILLECQHAKVNMYFMFIGIGETSFEFLKEIAKEFDNVGFLSVKDLARFVDADDLYEQLRPEELTKWLKQKVQ